MRNKTKHELAETN